MKTAPTIILLPPHRSCQAIFRMICISECNTNLEQSTDAVEYRIDDSEATHSPSIHLCSDGLQHFPIALGDHGYLSTYIRIANLRAVAAVEIFRLTKASTDRDSTLSLYASSYNLQRPRSLAAGTGSLESRMLFRPRRPRSRFLSCSRTELPVQLRRLSAEAPTDSGLRAVP